MTDYPSWYDPLIQTSLPYHVRRQQDAMVGQQGGFHKVRNRECRMFIRGALTGRLVGTLIVKMDEPIKPQLEREVERLQRLYPDNQLMVCHD